MRVYTRAQIHKQAKAYGETVTHTHAHIRTRSHNSVPRKTDCKQRTIAPGCDQMTLDGQTALKVYRTDDGKQTHRSVPPRQTNI